MTFWTKRLNESPHPIQKHIQTLAIVGVGLIGGSLSLALKQSGTVGRIIGVGRSQVNLDLALACGAIDQIQPDLQQAVDDADVIVLATPVNTIAALFETIAPAMNEDKIVTDVGSVKCGIVEQARRALGVHFNRFVAAHPIAGKEQSGITAATSDLFKNHNVILTPTEKTDSDAIISIEQMWHSTGAEVKSMDATEHDSVLSITSHLPHVLAYVMMDFLSTSSQRERCYEMAAGGFYDFTRTASSDPEMWRDISLMNKPYLLADIEAFKKQLDRVAVMIKMDDQQAIENLYASAKQARARVTEKRKNTTV